MRSCDGHGAASQGNDQGNWRNPKASLFTDPRTLPGRMTEFNIASPVVAFCPSLSGVLQGCVLASRAPTTRASVWRS
jgi:hypothetical protein